MKSYLKIVVISIFVGGILAFLFYLDIKNEVIATTSKEDVAYVFQTGVFNSLENAQNFSEKFPSSGIYKDNDFYRVIVSVTIENKDKLESFYKSLEIDYYIKEVVVNENVLEKIRNYDKVIAKTEKFEVLNMLNKSCVELFLND